MKLSVCKRTDNVFSYLPISVDHVNSTFNLIYNIRHNNMNTDIHLGDISMYYHLNRR